MAAKMRSKPNHYTLELDHGARGHWIGRQKVSGLQVTGRKWRNLRRPQAKGYLPPDPRVIHLWGTHFGVGSTHNVTVIDKNQETGTRRTQEVQRDNNTSLPKWYRGPRKVMSSKQRGFAVNNLVCGATRDETHSCSIFSPLSE